MDESISGDAYITFLVHEAFHVYQWDRVRIWVQKSWENGTLSENSGILLDRAYQDARVQELQRQEGKWLFKALQASNRQDIVRYAKEFLKVRAERRQRMKQILGPNAAHAIECERIEEWGEGLARYMEIKSWQIGSTPGYHPTQALLSDPTFHGYRDRQSYTGYRWGAKALIDEIGQGMTGDYTWYTLGSGQALVMDKLNVPWHNEAMGPVPLEELLMKWVDSASQ